jgi:SNF2 family DNA or RNA helicase
MRKLADIITDLKPHQQRVVERMRTQPGLVVAHGMGSGKTLTAIATAEDQKAKNTVVVPAALQSNFKKELGKHIEGTPEASYKIDSLQRVALKQKVPQSDLLTVDEAHRLRDPQSEGRKAIRLADTKKRMLLTGTPTYNRPYDLASLVNLASGQNVFPAVQQEFDKKYIRERKVDPGWFARTFRGVKPGAVTELQNQEELGKHLGRWVDFHENSTEGFPQREDQTVQVAMHPKQREMYESVMGKAPAWVRYKVRKGLPPNKQESKDLNAFASAVRQISNSPGGFQEGMTPDDAVALSPKIQEAYKRLSTNLESNPQHRALVYSNFLDAGIHPYESLLKQHNVAYGKFTGEMPKSERDRMVADYNEGKLKALLLSSAGGEGLDLKGTRQIQVLEPHWNKEKLEQVIARGIRYKSHEHLPEDQRRVAVEHYQSVHPEPNRIKKFFGAKRPGAIDEYLTQMSKDKDTLNSQVRDLLRQHAQGQTKKAGLVELVARHAARLAQVA